MLKITDISAKKIKEGQFQKELPEIYALKNVVENNDWHNNDSVFDHTLAVLVELKGLLKKVNTKTNSYLNQKIDTHSRKELLLIAALLHDIAKNSTLVKNSDSTTVCPKHEEVGAKKAGVIGSRFGLSKKEKELVSEIIRHHGEVNTISGLPSEDREEKYQKFKSEHPNALQELILLGTADALGSQLKDNKPDSFESRINFYKRVLALS